MPDSNAVYANARNIAVDILRGEKDRTPELIHGVAEKAIQFATSFASGVSLDVEELAAELHHLFSIRAGEVTILDDNVSGVLNIG